MIYVSRILVPDLIHPLVEVVGWCLGKNLKLSTRYPSLGHYQKVQVKVNYHLGALLTVTWHELQSNLHMTATLLGLKVPSRSPDGKQGQLLLVLVLRPLSKK